MKRITKESPGRTFYDIKLQNTSWRCPVTFASFEIKIIFTNIKQPLGGAAVITCIFIGIFRYLLMHIVYNLNS